VSALPERSRSWWCSCSPASVAREREQERRPTLVAPIDSVQILIDEALPACVSIQRQACAVGRRGLVRHPDGGPLPALAVVLAVYIVAMSGIEPSSSPPRRCGRRCSQLPLHDAGGDPSGFTTPIRTCRHGC
jgi:hypothetical protein